MKNEKELKPASAMKAWAARDENGQLAFLARRPERPHHLDPAGVWQDMGGSSREWSEQYGPDPFPELTWESEPVEVEIAITGKDAACSK